MTHSTLLGQIEQGSAKALARAISLVEAEGADFEDLLAALPQNSGAKVAGITGPPGAGKSTLVDGLIGKMVATGKKVAVLCVDPSSPFNFGALLGDRIRMSDWYTHPQVFIRSLASRGALGGLHPKIIEITKLVKSAGFDFILVETVGVGQSEVDIAGLADTTLVVLVPEGGDEVQTMKAGIMEVGDAFVVNKADRPGADTFIKHLKTMLAPAFSHSKKEVPIFKTAAANGEGLDALFEFLSAEPIHKSEKRLWLLTEKAYQIIQSHRMRTLPKEMVLQRLQAEVHTPAFNLYRFAQSFFQ